MPDNKHPPLGSCRTLLFSSTFWRWKEDLVSIVRVTQGGTWGNRRPDWLHSRVWGWWEVPGPQATRGPTWRRVSTVQCLGPPGSDKACVLHFKCLRGPSVMVLPVSLPGEDIVCHHSVEATHHPHRDQLPARKKRGLSYLDLHIIWVLINSIKLIKKFSISKGKLF